MAVFVDQLDNFFVNSVSPCFTLQFPATLPVCLRGIGVFINYNLAKDRKSRRNNLRTIKKRSHLNRKLSERLTFSLKQRSLSYSKPSCRSFSPPRLLRKYTAISGKWRVSLHQHWLAYDEATHKWVTNRGVSSKTGSSPPSLRFTSAALCPLLDLPSFMIECEKLTGKGRNNWWHKTKCRGAPLFAPHPLKAKQKKTNSCLVCPYCQFLHNSSRREKRFVEWNGFTKGNSSDKPISGQAILGWLLDTAGA